LVGQWFAEGGISVGFTTIAVVMAQIFVSAPFYVIAARGGFARVDRDVEAAAADLGATPGHVFRTVTLPLIAPGGGDELQGVKRGIVELADLVVVNKADGDLTAVATATASDYAAALHLVRPRSNAWTPRVLTCSALEQRGVDELWDAIEDFARATAGTEQEARRRDQARAWMRDELADNVLERLHDDAATAAAADDLEADVAEGRLAPTTAARRLLDVFFNRR
jgi:LAO/AO transport system kinase